MKQEFIRVGRIVNAHGIRGCTRTSPAARLFTLTDRPLSPTPIMSTRTWCC